MLTLASTSPARKKILTEAGIGFQVISPGVDEEALVELHQPTSACELTLLLAKAKGEAGAKQASSRLVLGCDSALEFNGEILGKPLVPEIAIQRWQQMRGGSGFLHSGHHLIDNETGTGVSICSQTEVHFANLSDSEIERYVATGEPLQVAGAFTIDSIGGAYVTKISGDYHTVVGLSLVALRQLMGELGLQYELLWR